MGLKGAFQCLNDDATRKTFDDAILRMIQETEYTVITALIDKQWMLRQRHWTKNHPYHYLMEILVEKYARFLIRKNDIGDVMPESRQNPKDALLQKAEEPRSSHQAQGYGDYGPPACQAGWSST